MTVLLQIFFYVDKNIDNIISKRLYKAKSFAFKYCKVQLCSEHGLKRGNYYAYLILLS